MLRKGFSPPEHAIQDQSFRKRKSQRPGKNISASQLSIIDSIFQPIYGKPCWHVKQGYGSFLTLEFGQPSLQIREPQQASRQTTEKARTRLSRRHISAHGDWHLWVYMCAWRITLHDQELANNTSNRRTIKEATTQLEGQLLSRAYVDKALVSVLEFDLGGKLELYPDSDEYEQFDPLWHLYEPSGYVFTLRTDGQYCHMLGNARPEEEVWQPLVIPESDSQI